MSLAEAEKRRGERRPSDATDGSTDREADDGGVPNGVLLVAGVAGLGGVVDILTGLPMLPTPLFALGGLLVAFGALKCRVAVGLLRLRTRALGLAVLLYGAGALVDGLRLVFAIGTDGSAVGPAARILLALVVVGYLLVRADRFE